MEEAFKNPDEVYNFFISKKILLSQDLMDYLIEKEFGAKQCEKVLLSADIKNCVVMNLDIFNMIEESEFFQINWSEFDGSLVERDFDSNSKKYETFIKFINSNTLKKSSLDNKKSFEAKISTKKHVQDNKSNISATIGLDKNLDEKGSEPFDNSSMVSCNCDDSLDGDINKERKNLFKNRKEQKENIEPNYDLEQIKLKEPDFGNFEIIFNYEEMDKKREIGDFISFFKHRYNFLKGVLSSRNQLSSAVSIKRLAVKNTNDRNESVSVIGLINSISKTQKGNFIINIEDPTGSINVMVSSDNPELVELCEDIVLDEVIGIEGALSKKMIYATRIYKPDIPFGSSIKKSPDEVYALFLSDIHVGSNMFLEEDLNRFLKWINQESGNEEQKRVAGLVKYIFILGDIVDGVGIYPGQEKELEIKDIYEQYEKAAEFIKRMPIEKNIFIIPGNHDALRLSEPQPALSRLYAEPFYKMPNVTLLTNPSSIRIHKRPNFSGFDVLMYHGYSFDYYVANVDTIRKQGGYDRADLIMKFLLHTRHLAPTHTSSLYVPETRDDFLLIKQIPDFFVTGHIHKTSVSNYKGITLISGSCWQARTSFQEKVGHHPEPSRVPIVNLQTREVKILNFSR